MYWIAGLLAAAILLLAADRIPAYIRAKQRFEERRRQLAPIRPGDIIKVTTRSEGFSLEIYRVTQVHSGRLSLREDRTIQPGLTGIRLYEGRESKVRLERESEIRVLTGQELQKVLDAAQNDQSRA